MPADHAGPVQPADETPLAGVSPVEGVSPDGPQAEALYPADAEAPAEFADAEQAAGRLLATALTDVYAAIDGIIGSASDPVRRAVVAAKRAVTTILKAEEEAGAERLLGLNAAGVPVSFSPAERTNELADDSLRGVLDRVERALTQPPPAADADQAAEAFAPAPPAGGPGPDPGGVYGCSLTGTVWGAAEYDYPRPGPLPPGKLSTTCAKFTPGLDFATGQWKWNYDAFGWPGGPLNTPPRPADPPYPASENAPPYITVCYIDVCQRKPPAPAPSPEPDPDETCSPNVWDVSGPDDGAILHAPGGTGSTPVPPHQQVVISASNGKCYWADLPTVPDPLPRNVAVVNDDQTPPGCIAIRGVSDECPPEPESEPEPEPEPEPSPSPSPKPDPTCPAPPPPTPPIVIPACPVEEKPKPPDQVITGVGAGAGMAGFNMDDPLSCGLMAAAAVAGRPVDPDATVAADGSVTYTPGITAAGWTLIGTSAAMTPIVIGLERLSVNLARTVLDQAVGVGLVSAAWARRPRAALPNASVGMDVGARLSLAAQAEQKSGLPLTYMFQSERYYFQWLNPQYQPGQASIDRMYLADRISLADWNCYTRREGNLPDLAFQSMLSSQSLPNDHDVVQARLRGIIPTDAAYLARMRQLGYVEPARAAEKLLLAKQIPGPADLVRMMVRDSADDAVAAAYGYDSDFGAKFTGQVRQWAEWQGMDATYFQYLWRAHWDIPSNTALYSMYHRLRPDTPAVQRWDTRAAAVGAVAATAELGPRPPVVQLADVRRAMQINDMAPTWVDPLLAVSFHPITNTDARRAFNIGFIGFDELVSRTQDNGYSKADATMLASFFQAERERSITASTGVGSPRQILRAYIEGMIDYPTADNALREYMPDPVVRARQLTKADLQSDIETRRRVVKTVVKRFEYGEIDDGRARADLAAAGVGLVGVARVMARAEASRDGHMKEPRSTQVLEMWTRGILSRDKAYDRLWRLGYSDEDINNMLRVSGAKEQERQALRAMQEANRRRLEAKRNAEGALRLLKDEADRVSKAIKEAQKEYDRIQKLIQESGCPSGEQPGA